MKSYLKIIFIIGAVVGALALITLLLQAGNLAVLNPKGWVATEQRKLMMIATLLMLVVVIPVYVLTLVIAWKYRASNKLAVYTPQADHSRLLEGIWWGVPTIIIIVLAVITWTSSHALDPYKPLTSDKKPLTIQVVALQWKWLFIYPEQNIASLNFVQFPESTPVNFKITADSPFNSFWIPQLGGQIYAMPGMERQLYLIADSSGSYNGSSANLSGEGFSGMKFIARSSSKSDFDKWIAQAKKQPKALTMTTYNELAKPSKNNPPALYSESESGLYDSIIMKYKKAPTPLLKGAEPN